MPQHTNAHHLLFLMLSYNYRSEMLQQLLKSKSTTRHVVLVLLLLVTTTCSSTEVVSLTRDNFQAATQNKTVFIKFFAPWCDHCKALAPTWTKLASEWQNHSQGLVAEVDCTTEQGLCSELKVLGLPTLLYGEPSFRGLFLQRYDSSDKTYETLSAFANKTLVQSLCTPGNIDACHEHDLKETYLGYWKMSLAEIEDAISTKEAIIAKEEEDLHVQFQRLQQQYDDLATNHELLVSQIKQNIKVLKILQAQ